MTPFFSIIVPIFNAERFLDECVNSVINQKYSDWELILVDDGSTDSSGYLCDKYSKTNDNIFVVHQENKGQFFARESGINRARGSFFIFLDSDDFLQPDALMVLQENLKEEETDLILYDSYHYTNGKQENAEDNIDFSGLFFDKKEIIRQCFLKRTSRISMCAYCFKNTLFNGVSNNSPHKQSRSQEDFLMTYSLVENAHSLRVTDKILYNYRTNADSTSHNIDVLNFYKGLKISSDIYEAIIDKYHFNVSKDFDDYIIKRLAWLPLSYLIRCALTYPAKTLKQEFQHIKKNFLYIYFTNKHHFKGKLYNLFVFSLKLGLFRFAKKIASRLL